jgi:hypothetical protein
MRSIAAADVADADRESVLTAEEKVSLAALRAIVKEMEAKLPPEPEMSCSVEEGTETVELLTGKVRDPRRCTTPAERTRPKASP